MTSLPLSKADFASLRVPVIALVLSILPFWIFVGARDAKTYNGEIIEFSHLNLIGLVVAVAGLVIAVRWFVRQKATAPRPVFALLVAAAAIFLSLVQIGQSTEVFTLGDAKRLATRQIGWPPLPAPRFTDLGPKQVADLRTTAASSATDVLVSNISRTLAMTNGLIIRHNAYGAKCYGGLGARELLAVPPAIRGAQRKIYDDYVDAMRRQPVTICSDVNTDKYMGDFVNEINENAATLDILVAELRRRPAP